MSDSSFTYGGTPPFFRTRSRGHPGSFVTTSRLWSVRHTN